MLGITLRDKVRNEEIRKRTGIKDFIQKTRKEKHRWAAWHVGRLKENRSKRKITERTPRTGSRPPGRPKNKMERWDTGKYGISLEK